MPQPYEADNTNFIFFSIVKDIVKYSQILGDRDSIAILFEPPPFQPDHDEEGNNAYLSGKIIPRMELDVPFPLAIWVTKPKEGLPIRQNQRS